MDHEFLMTNSEKQSEPPMTKRPTIHQIPNEYVEKRNFIILLLLICVVLVGTAVLLWWIPYVGFRYIHPQLPWIMAVGFALACVAMLVV